MRVQIHNVEANGGFDQIKNSTGLFYTALAYRHRFSALLLLTVLEEGIGLVGCRLVCTARQKPLFDRRLVDDGVEHPRIFNGAHIETRRKRSVGSVAHLVPDQFIILADPSFHAQNEKLSMRKRKNQSSICNHVQHEK
jgi:hypothetical protein